MNKLFNIGILLGITMVFLSSCTPGVNKPGSEYMPDMGHSIAYEANVIDDYSLNTWDDESVVKYEKMAAPRNSVEGTVPRGYMNTSPKALEGIRYPLNGFVPFHYGDSEDERTRAANEILDNPFPISDLNLSQGKEMYDINCAICHGKKGDGNGYIARDDGYYPSQPADLISDKFTSVSNGHYYYTIMYGKNVMQSHADKLSYKERWQLIHYIRSLQSKKGGKLYNADVNTFDNHATPINTMHVKVDHKNENVEIPNNHDDHSAEVHDSHGH